ncbi:MAG TPA: hypothetical protein DD417_17270 [Elusimicrobia bacterium]|nr:hypothetical protein [Elusimicrobiota bacterium]
MATDTTISAEELLSEILSSARKEKAPVEREPEADLDIDKIRQTTPPSRGLCRRCGENKPINRLMLCYPCWVKSSLEDQGWREGMPHPDWCHCETQEGHPGKRSAGN